MDRTAGLFSLEDLLLLANNYPQSGGAGYGDSRRIDWGPPKGQRPPGPGARPQPAPTAPRIPLV